MLIFKKKYQIWFGFFLLSLSLVAFNVRPARALSHDFVQVKVAGSPAVYFLSWKTGLKKTYINAAAYLSYGNKWSDIKTVSAAALQSWPEASLFRVAGSPDIYYIQGHQKVRVQSPSDLARFKLVGLPVLTVSATDLDQYQTSDYTAVGWTVAGNNGNNSGDNNGNNSGNTPPSGQQIAVYNDLVQGANGNSFIPNTKSNLLGVFRFVPTAATTINSVTFNLAGVYSSAIISNVVADDASGADYGANINWRGGDKTIVVNFRPALALAAGQSASVKILTDLNACTNCNNQTMHLELPGASAVNATLPAAPASSSWPLAGTTFHLVTLGGNVLGQPVVQGESIASSTAGVTSGTRIISQFLLKETSGNEDVQVKQITLTNSGTASFKDWANFVLLQDGNVVARANQLNSNGQIVFAINYLKIPKNGTDNMMVTAGLLTNYNTQATYSLGVSDLQSVGLTTGMSLTPVINNVSESFTLN